MAARRKVVSAAKTKVGKSRKRADELQRAIYRIAEAANSVAGLPDLLGKVHRIVGELLPAQNFYIAIYDSATGQISFPYWIDERMPSPPTTRGLKHGLTEYVLRTGEPLLVTPPIHRELEEQGAITTRGVPALDWIGIPLKVQEHVFGVVVVQTYSDGVRYGERERDILQFVSTQIAMAIERRRVEERLRESENRYRMFFESNPEAMWVYDTETLRILAVNDAATRRYGWTREEFLTMTIRDLRPSSEQKRLDEVIARKTTPSSTSKSRPTTRPSPDARRGSFCSATSRTAISSRTTSARRRRWKRSVSSPVESRMTSTIS
jgi:PAS domain S-box-containing protein